MSTMGDDSSDEMHVLAKGVTYADSPDSGGEDDAGKTRVGWACKEDEEEVDEAGFGQADVGGTSGEEKADSDDNDDDMTYSRTIVVGVDGSAQSYHAFHWYITNMHVEGNYVILVHAFELPVLHSFQEMYVSPQMWQATLKREACHTNTMEKRLSGVLSRCKIPGRFEARGGKAGDVIVAVAEEMDADVVVVGTRGHSKVRRVVMGSVSGYVTRHAPCTVMVCRQKGRLRTQSSGSRTSVASGSTPVRPRQESSGSQSSPSSPCTRVRFDMSHSESEPRLRQRYHSTGSMATSANNPEKKKPENLFKSILSRKRNKSECDVRGSEGTGRGAEVKAANQRLISTEAP